MTLQQITEAALSLTEEERSELAYQLLQSLGPDDNEDYEEAWNIEIQRRIKEIDEGSVKLISAEEFRKKALALLK